MKKRFALLGLVLAFVWMTRRSSAQDVLQSFLGDSKDQYAGYARVIEDANGDATPDIAIVATTGWTAVASVRVHSGRDGTLIREHFGGYQQTFGVGITTLGDFDADGTGDYAIGSQYEAGAIYVYSGVDGRLLEEYAGRDDERFFGGAFAPLGDVDGDGAPDFVVAIGCRDSRCDVASVAALSGEDAHELWSIDGARFDGLGRGLDWIHDLDGDGIREVVVSSPTGSPAHVDVLSGADGTVLLRRDGPLNLGVSLEVVSDLDGDQVDDLLIGGADQVDVFSVGKETVLYSVPVTKGFGSRVARAGDTNRDGFEDFLVSPANGVGLISGSDGATLFDFPGFSQVQGGLDFDADGWPDLLLGDPTDSSKWAFGGRVDVVSVSTHPRVTSVEPPRAHYRGGDTVTVKGRYFTVGSVPTIELAGIAASDVTVIDDANLTCTVPSGTVGPAEIRASNELGAHVLGGAFAFTPAAFVEGDLRPGGSVLVRWWIEPGDAIFGIFGLPPPAALPTPPFDGTLAIVPFMPLFVFSWWPTDEFRYSTSIPDDPTLSGLEVLFQALAGPKLYGSPKDGSWTNAALLQIE